MNSIHSYFIPCANGVAALVDPVFINLWYEPNGAHNNYYPGWQGGIGGALGTLSSGEIGYRDAYRHVVNVFRSHGASNAIFVWCLQGPSTDGWYQNLYPGDAYVDIIGVDLYRATFRSRCTNPGTFNGGVHTQDYYNFAQGTSLTGPQATALQRNAGVVKAFMICEAGLKDGGSIPDVSAAGGDGLNYDKDGAVTGHSAINKLLADLKVFENCIGYLHWNELGDPTLSGSGNYVDTTAAAKTQYSQFYNDPYCQVYFGGAPSGGKAPTTGSPTISDTTPQQGQVLSVDINPTSWDGAQPLGFSGYQWYWEDTSAGALQPISGATSATYTVVAGDVGHRLKARVVGTNSIGSLTVYTALTAAVLGTGSTALSTVPAAGTPGFYSSLWTTTNSHAGRVQRTVSKNGVTYVCGEFDHVVDNSGASPVDRTNTPYLCAYRKDTGAVIQTWLPNPNDYVHDLKLNAAGTKLIMVGKFTSIGGSTRTQVAIAPLLTGPTDTSAFSLDSSMPNLSLSGELWRVLLDETNNRGWLCGNSAAGYVKRIDLNAGAWRVSSGWTPPSFSTGSGSGGVYLRAICRISGNIYVGGSNITPTLAKLNADTGANQTFTGAPSNSTPGLFDLQTDGTIVYIFGGEDAGDLLIAVDGNGGGPNSLVHGSGTDNGYWFHRCDGNVQAGILGTVNGQACVIYGHHGDVQAAVKNSTSMPDVSHGLVIVKAGTTGGDPIGYGHPPDFSRTPSTGSPLKIFAVDVDENGDLHCAGDFTTVNSFAANVFQRYARFNGSAASVPVNSAIPTLDNVAPSVGNTVTIASLGSWSGSPSSYVTAIILRDGGGVETIVKTGTGVISYLIQSGDSTKTVIADVVAVNAFGQSTHARSAASAPIGSNPTAPNPPVIVPGSKPTDPTTSPSNEFFWTEAGSFDHFRYRLSADGTAGPWTTTTATSILLDTPAGKRYTFEVQAGTVNNLYSASDTYSWTVTASAVPAAPTLTTTPPASSAAKSVAFVWNNPESVSGYKWQYKLDRPSQPTPPWSTAQDYRVHDARAPLEVGSYTFHVRAINSAGTVGPESTFAFAITATTGGHPDAVVFSTVPPEEDTDNVADFTWT